jgi:hypothetical protein
MVLVLEQPASVPPVDTIDIFTVLDGFDAVSADIAATVRRMADHTAATADELEAILAEMRSIRSAA